MGLEIENRYSYAEKYGLQEKEKEKLESGNESIFPYSNMSEEALAPEDIQEQSSTDTQEKEGPVGFFEGVGLFFKGAVNKVKNMGKAIIEHPIKTLAAVGATTALITAAPLIGITSATAGAFLAVGFGVFAVGKTICDVVETVKDNKSGKYDEVREDIENLGGDGVNLALTLPFMPKAINQISRFFKYGTSTVGLNTELIGNIVKGNGSIPIELAKANTKINYEMIANEMDLAVKPELEFFSRLPDKDGHILGGEFDPVTGKLRVNEKTLTGINRLQSKLKGINSEATLRHELEHFQQFSEIAKSCGIENLQEAINKYYTAVYKNNGGTFNLLGEGELQEAADGTVANRDMLYDKACEDIQAKLINHEITPDETGDMYHDAFENAWNKATQPVYDSYQQSIESKFKALNKMKELGFDYRNSENILFDDGSAINKEFWQQVIDSNATPSAQAGNSAEYINAYIDKGMGKADEQLAEQLAEKYGIKQGFEGIADRTFRPRAYAKYELELYKSNLLEQEAYGAQELFNAQTVQGRPGFVADGAQALATAENYFTEDDENIEEYIINAYKNKSIRALLTSKDKNSSESNFFTKGGLIGYLTEKLAD